jgi:3-oxoacyl-[acyl-carrier-protein] synthase II
VSSRRRVVVTGIGAITPIGMGASGLWAGIEREASAVAPLTRFDPSIFRSHNAAQVDDFSAADHMETASGSAR